MEQPITSNLNTSAPILEITTNEFIKPELENADISTSSSGLLELPPELLEKIFDEYINHTTKLQIRQVHSLFQVLLDDYIGFKISLDNDDAQEKLDFISEIAIRKATILNMSTSTKNFSKYHEKENTEAWRPIFDDIFLYPQYLLEIDVKGDIDARFLTEMIRKCKVIKKFELCPGSNVTSYRLHRHPSNGHVDELQSHSSQEVLPEINISSASLLGRNHCLTRCHTLKLHLKDHDSSSLYNLNGTTILAILKSIRSSYLECVVFEFWISEQFSVSKITLATAECLEQNPFIKSFFAGFIYDHLLDTDDPISTEEESLQEIIKTKFKNASRFMQIEKLGIAIRSQDFQNFWLGFIKGQHHLVHISLTLNLDTGISFSEMFQTCGKSLKQFILRGRFLTAFDFTWIEDCHQLKEICLHNTSDNDKTIEGPSIHVVNTAYIPVGVESLILFQTVTRTNEIIVTLKKLKNLDTLVLFKTGNVAGETGVNTECLKQIFGSSRMLQSVLLVRFVASTPIEAQKLIRILKCVNEGHVLIDPIGATEILQQQPTISVPALENIYVEGVVEEPEAETNVDEAQAIDAIANKNEVDVDQTLSNSIDEHLDISCPEPQNTEKVVEQNGAACESSIIIKKIDTDIEQLPEGIDASKIPEKNSTQSIYLCTTMEPNLLTEIVPNSVKTEDVEGSEYSKEQLPEVDNNSISEIRPETYEINNPPANNSLRSEKIDNPQNDLNENDSNASDPEWIDIDDDVSDYEDNSDDDYIYDSDTDSDEGDNDVFDFDLDGLNFQMEDGIVDGQDLQLFLNLNNEGDLQEVIGMLEPVAADNVNNIFFSFILDGVIDIMNPETTNLSKWVSTEDTEGQITYTLRINIE